MQKQRIYVTVAGFSDVERHALNTVFRLSEERELAYAPWVPLVAPGGALTLKSAEVMLVDGESAEAVLSHAREAPTGQRLIWVGANAPEHAWRVLQRPIQWAQVLHDLDAVYAAQQVDSGYLDLDFTLPSPLGSDSPTPPSRLRRALLVGTSVMERETLRLRLAAVAVSEIDEVGNTESTVELVGRNTYCCGVFNLDDQHLDAWSLARFFADSNPQALTFGLSENAGPHASWWRRRRLRSHAERAGITTLLARPLRAYDLLPWVERLSLD